MSNEVVPCSMTMGLAVLSILAPEVTYEPAWPENAVYGNSADVEALNTSGGCPFCGHTLKVSVLLA